MILMSFPLSNSPDLKLIWCYCEISIKEQLLPVFVCHSVSNAVEFIIFMEIKVSIRSNIIVTNDILILFLFSLKCYKMDRTNINEMIQNQSKPSKTTQNQPQTATISQHCLKPTQANYYLILSQEKSIIKVVEQWQIEFKALR